MLSSTSRILTSRLATRAITSRAFSGSCEPAQRIREVLAEYRKENFSREIPTRFKKQVLAPYVGGNDAVEVDQLNLLLKNIGHPQDCLSTEEQNELLREAGSSNRCITVKKMMELID
mmetsp:Transcript_125713/g.177402  ORF Transcript_125713/g.177402 Transcript_125713/m.177402 type:complete len:117 (+) Transcript_125713:177-527(+)